MEESEYFNFQVSVQGDFDGWGYIQRIVEYFDNEKEAVEYAKKATSRYGAQYIVVYKHFMWGNQPPSLFKWVKE